MAGDLVDPALAADIADTVAQLADTKTVAKSVLAAPERKIAFEVGDSKQAEFFPQFKTLHWDNECNFSARLADDDPAKADIAVDAEGKIVWQKGDKTAKFYAFKDPRFEDGGFEIEIGHASKPPTNKTTFTLQTKGFTFHKQGLAIAKAADPDMTNIIVPENMEGGYVAMHATKANNFNAADGTPIKHYRTGQAFIILRPKAIDAKGTEAWGDLNIDADAGLMTVTLPQDFIDNAVYPITHVAGATFGYTTQGASAGSVTSTNSRAMVGSAFRHTGVTGDTITMYSLSNLHGVTNASVDMTVYDFNGTVPVNRTFAGTTVADTGGGGGWNNSSAVSQSLVNGTVYVVALGISLGTVNIDFNALSAGDRSNTTGTDLPDPWSESGTSANVLSMYATYTAGGGGGFKPYWATQRSRIIGSGVR